LRRIEVGKADRRSCRTRAGGLCARRASVSGIAIPAPARAVGGAERPLLIGLAMVMRLRGEAER